QSSVSNGQCSITGAGSSVVASGNTLTLTLAITFTPSFAGNKVLYLAAQNGVANSGWQALATFGITGTPPGGPAVTGVSPAHTTGTGQGPYIFSFTDTNGWQDISVLNILVNTAINGAS